MFNILYHTCVKVSCNCKHNYAGTKKRNVYCYINFSLQPAMLNVLTVHFSSVQMLVLMQDLPCFMISNFNHTPPYKTNMELQNFLVCRVMLLYTFFY